jgi:hypothetical protein
MKKFLSISIVTVLIMLMSACQCQAQDFKIYDNDGLIGITSIDDKGYIVVDVDGTTSELYDKVKLYVNELMVNPEFSIVAEQDGKFLKWKTRTGISKFKQSFAVYYIYCNYLTSVHFKDNKMKIEYSIQSCDVSAGTATGDVLYTYSAYTLGIYKKNGKTWKQGITMKNDIETYFDNNLQNLENSLTQELVDESW